MSHESLHGRASEGAEHTYVGFGNNVAHIRSSSKSNACANGERCSSQGRRYHSSVDASEGGCRKERIRFIIIIIITIISHHYQQRHQHRHSRTCFYLSVRLPPEVIDKTSIEFAGTLADGVSAPRRSSFQSTDCC